MERECKVYNIWMHLNRPLVGLRSTRTGTDNGRPRQRRRGSAGHGVAAALTPAPGQPPHYSSAPRAVLPGSTFVRGIAGHPTRFPSARHGGGWPAGAHHRSGLAVWTELSALLTATNPPII
jgi:hypothetical protein